MANKNIVDLLNHLASRKADVSSVYTTEEVNSLTGANRELIEANTQADISILKTDSVALTVSNDKVNASSLKLGEGVLYPAEDLL